MLELGSGLGTLGLVLSTHGLASSISMTDLPQSLDYLRCNVLKNRDNLVTQVRYWALDAC